MRSTFSWKMRLLYVFKNIFKQNFTKLIKTIFAIFFLYVIITIYTIIYFKVMSKGNNIHYIVVHLDLKGAPPKLNYLKSLLPVIKKYGANGILIEYEDMFPYEGKLVNLSAANCYNKRDLFKFISTAVDEGFEVIPLIQTFGHLEYVLKHEEFKHLRESPTHPDSICPSKKESHDLITNMLSQVIEFHQSIHQLNYMHIGMDEVYHINMCQLCKTRKLQTENLFQSHVVKISSVVKNLHPHINVLIWDDMLRRMSIQSWNSHQLSKYVQPVYWAYTSHLRNPIKKINMYHKYFNGVWVASAFKGADGRNLDLPNLAARFKNHFSWMKFMKMFRKYKPVNFKGIFLTGWSRYNHFSPLCDLLPASIPSLLLSLILVNEFNKSTEALAGGEQQFYNKFIEKPFRQSLGCWRNLNPPLEYMNFSDCRFKESNIYHAINDVNNLKYNCIKSLKYDVSVLKFHLKKRLNFSNFIPLMDYKLCNDFVNTAETKLETALNPYYDNKVISEFTTSKLSSDLKYINDTVFLLRNHFNIIL